MFIIAICSHAISDEAPVFLFFPLYAQFFFFNLEMLGVNDERIPITFFTGIYIHRVLQAMLE